MQMERGEGGGETEFIIVRDSPLRWP